MGIPILIGTLRTISKVTGKLRNKKTSGDYPN